MHRQLTTWFTSTRILKLWYLPILSLGMILMYARLLALAYVLPVEQFSEYSVGILVSSSFLMLACFGLHALLQRELPVLYVHGKVRKGMVLVIQCVAVSTLSALILAALSLTFDFSVADVTAPTLALGLLHGLSQQYFLVATTDSRSRGDPLKYSTDNLLRSIVVLLGSLCVAIWGHDAAQVLVIEILLSLLLSWRLLRQQLSHVGFWSARASMLATRKLADISWGSPLTLVMLGVSAFLLLNLDRWVAAHLLSKAQFAHYAFAWTVLMAAQSAQVMLNAALYPMIARRLASNVPVAAFRLTLLASFSTLIVGAAGSFIAWLGMEILIPLWFPAYSSAIPLLPFFLAIATLRFSDYWSTYLVIAKQENLLVTINTVLIISCPTLWWIIIRPAPEKSDLTHPALLAALLQLFCYLATMIAAYRCASAQEKHHNARLRQ